MGKGTAEPWSDVAGITMPFYLKLKIFLLGGTVSPVALVFM